MPRVMRTDNQTSGPLLRVWFYLRRKLAGYAFIVGLIWISFQFAGYFPPNKSVQPVHAPAINSSVIPPSKGVLTEEEKIALRPQVQKMISDGAFNPPPGRVSTNNASVSPFIQEVVHVAAVDANGTQPATTVQSVQSAADSSRQPVKASRPPNEKTPQKSPDFLAPTIGSSPTPFEFETPPGIGSVRGGQ
jgi:hypothetical protein